MIKKINTSFLLSLGLQLAFIQPSSAMQLTPPFNYRSPATISTSPAQQERAHGFLRNYLYQELATDQDTQIVLFSIGSYVNEEGGEPEAEIQQHKALQQVPQYITDAIAQNPNLKVKIFLIDPVFKTFTYTINNNLKIITLPLTLFGSYDMMKNILGTPEIQQIIQRDINAISTYIARIIARQGIAVVADMSFVVKEKMRRWMQTNIPGARPTNLFFYDINDIYFEGDEETFARSITKKLIIEPTPAGPEIRPLA